MEFKRTYTGLVGLMFFILFFYSCDKPTIVDPIPAISNLQLSHTTIEEFSDSLELIFDYVDGDGNLGENNTEAENLFVTDLRINITHAYRIQQLAPDNSEIPIQGTLRVNLLGLGITDGSTQQSTTFNVYVTDREGNKSNTLVSEEIIILKP